jgi:hypothetical protein
MFYRGKRHGMCPLYLTKHQSIQSQQMHSSTLCISLLINCLNDPIQIITQQVFVEQENIWQGDNCKQRKLPSLYDNL